MFYEAIAFVQKEKLLLVPLCLLLVFGVSGIGLTTSEPVPDFSKAVDTAAKKTAFFDYLTPHITTANTNIEADRAQLLNYADKQELNWRERLHLRRLRLLYLNSDIPEEDTISELLMRVDIVPPSLALIQAAKESGWGSSRFARNGYNFFGQQCFNPGCGFTPRTRNPGRRHEVARFQDIEDAVRSYIHNLNTHPRYEEFRAIRHALRDLGEPLSGLELADGLQSYSERGDAYVLEVKDMIRNNGLE